MSIKATQPEDSAVHVEAVATIVRRNGELEIDWLVEGGISALECEGVVLYTAERPITDDDGSGEVYLATPQPAEPTIREQDMAMMIRRIVSKARRHCEDDSPVLKLANEAWGLMHRLGMMGSPLRDESPQPAEAKTAAVDGMTDSVVFAIIFDDYDCKHEIIIGERNARARFTQISDSWNAHLFGKLESNSRDDRHANNNIARLPASGDAKDAQ